MLIKKLSVFLFLFLLINLSFSYNDPILYYTFDKGVGNTLIDSSVNKHDAFIEGSTTRISDSRILKGIEFDGIDSIIRIPYAENININDSFTISSWVYFNTSKSYQGFLSKGVNLRIAQTTAGGDIIGNNFQFEYNLNGTKPYYPRWIFPYKKWFYLTITYNGTNIVSYVDGEIHKTLPVLERTVYNQEDYIIGYGVDKWRSGFFKGYLDEFRIYDYVLNDIDINELYAYSFYPDLPDIENPTEPTNLKVDDKGKYSLSFSWDESTDDIGVVGYKIYRDSEFLENVYSTNYTDLNLNHSTNYTYNVIAFDPSGKESSSGIIKIQTLIKGDMYFFDDFESGDLLKPNLAGFTWALIDRVKTNNPYEGNYSMEFNFKGKGNILAHATAEQRFKLGDKYKNLWFKYYLYLPSNYYQRSPGILKISNSSNNFQIGEKVRKIGGSWKDEAIIKEVNSSEIFVEGLFVNNNFLYSPFNIESDSGATAIVDSKVSWGSNDKGLVFLWNKEYSGVAHTGLNFYPDITFNDGSAHLTVTKKTNGSGSSGHIPNDPKAVVFNTSSDLGKWLEFIIHIKLSEPEADDGMVEVWKNGNKLYELYDLNNWQLEPDNYLDQGYLLGWANAGFYENTTLYIDNFEVSTTPLTSSYIEDTQSPTTPTNLQVINVTNSSIEFNWNKSQDNVVIFEYEIYENSSLIGTTVNNYYTLSNLISNTTYLFEVLALDSSNNPSNLSLPLIVKTLEGSTLENDSNNTEPVLSKCGNGIKEEGEVCDKLQLDGKSCNSFSGYQGGILSCKNTCEFNLSSCVPKESSSSSGGGGNGGSSTFCVSCITNITIKEACIPSYKYFEWGLCQNGKQTQFIEDINDCEGDILEERQCREELNEVENFLLNAKKIELVNYEKKKYKASLDFGYNEIFYIEEKLEDSIFLFQDEVSGQEYYGQYYDEQDGKYFYTLKRVDDGYITILQEEGILSNSLYQDVNDLKQDGLFYKLIIGLVIILFFGVLGYSFYYVKKIKGRKHDNGF